MSYQWDPEQIIEPPMALQLIRGQFPELVLKHIRLLGAGWDNTAFINDPNIMCEGLRSLKVMAVE